MYQLDRLKQAEHLRERADKVLWLWLAGACILSGIAFLLDPAAVARRSAVGIIIYPYTYVWQIMLFAAGAALLYGLTRNRLEWEVAGLILLVGAVTINFAAIVLVSTGPLLSSIAVLPALIVAGSVRAHARIRLSAILREVRGQ